MIITSPQELKNGFIFAAAFRKNSKFKFTSPITRENFLISLHIYF